MNRSLAGQEAQGQTGTPLLRGEKVLVTGASGFIGSHLLRALAARGAEVHAVSRNTKRESGDRVRWWRGDVSDAGSVRQLYMSVRPDVVFHLASHVMGSPALENVLPTFSANLASSVNILTVAAELGCRRVVLAGSLAEPETSRGESIASSPYAASKWAGTMYANMFHALYGVPIVNARLFMVYGPDQKDRSKLVPYVTLSLLRGDSPKITSGKRMIDWVYVGDAVEGLLSAAVVPGLEGSSVEIGSGTAVSTREIVTAIGTLIGGTGTPLFGAIPDRPMEPARIADVARTLAQTGWSPSTPLESGLRDTIAWYREHGEDEA